jgi:hypothetical protein
MVGVGKGAVPGTLIDEGIRNLRVSPWVYKMLDTSEVRETFEKRCPVPPIFGLTERSIEYLMNRAWAWLALGYLICLHQQNVWIFMSQTWALLSFGPGYSHELSERGLLNDRKSKSSPNHGIRS